MPINLSGTFIEIKENLLKISSVVKFRKYGGWAAHQEDEDWIYHAIFDQRICLVCEGYGGISNFIGLDFQINWPDNRVIEPGDTLKRQRWAETHITNPELRGQCRCVLVWQHPVQTLRDRLQREMEDASA